MGMLAETKSRRKLNHDPNNTKWSRDETTFGQKILRSQGWQPGEYLGAQDAPHSAFHTAANASYIRVSLKDDMKGLGFDKRKEDEITGLNEFSDLLSRLNGKTTKSVEEEKAKRLEVKMHAYVQHRYGAMRFVRGGLLVGDELKKEEEEEDTTSETLDSDDGSSDADELPQEEKAPTSCKKRKAMDDENQDDGNIPSPSSSEEEETRKKRRRKEEKKAKSKKDKQDRKKSKKSSTEVSETDGLSDRKSKAKSKSKSSSPTGTDDEDEAKRTRRARKEEKRAKKELKRARKEEKKQKRKEKEAESGAAESADATITTTTTTTATATPVVSGTSTPRSYNPHRVRSRFLAAKREALMDQKALDKIWMVKT